MAASDAQVPPICQLGVLSGAGLQGCGGTARDSLGHCGIGLALGEGSGCGAGPGQLAESSSKSQLWDLPGAPGLSPMLWPQNLVRRCLWGPASYCTD